MSAGYTGNPEWGLRYSSFIKWRELDPFYKFTLAHARNAESIIPNMFPLQFNKQLGIDGNRWYSIEPYMDIFRRLFYFFGWLIKIKLVTFFDYLFSYTDGAQCSLKFWCYSWGRVIIFFVFVQVAFLNMRSDTTENSLFTINLNLDMIVFIKKYLSIILIDEKITFMVLTVKHKWQLYRRWKCDIWGFKYTDEHCRLIYTNAGKRKWFGRLLPKFKVDIYNMHLLQSPYLQIFFKIWWHKRKTWRKTTTRLIYKFDRPPAYRRWREFNRRFASIRLTRLYFLTFQDHQFRKLFRTTAKWMVTLRLTISDF